MSSEEILKNFRADNYFVCIDDTPPPFPVNMWIEKGRKYKLIIGSQVKDVMSGEFAFQFEDEHGNIIIPNAEKGVEHIKLERFFPSYQIPLN